MFWGQKRIMENSVKGSGEHRYLERCGWESGQRGREGGKFRVDMGVGKTDGLEELSRDSGLVDTMGNQRWVRASKAGRRSSLEVRGNRPEVCLSGDSWGWGC